MDGSDIRPPSLLALPSYVVANVARALHGPWLRELSKHDLRPWHFAMLAALADFGPLAQSELADRLNIKRSNLVSYLDELEERNLVTRARDANDRRRQRVALTSAGRALLQRLQEHAERSQAGPLSVLSDAERTTLLSLLSRVLRSHDEARLRDTLPIGDPPNHRSVSDAAPRTSRRGMR